MAEITSIGNWIRRRRKALDLTQAKLAERVGCAVITIKKIEGDERRPSSQMAELLADHLAIPEEEREAFLRLARGEWVEALSAPAPTFRPPTFLSETGDDDPASTTFVGREQELAQLQAQLDHALKRNGRVLFVTGDAGRGKTALLAEFARRAQARYESLLSASGTCHALSGTGDPFLPFREVLNMLSGAVESRWAAGDISAEQARRLWRFAPKFGLALADHGPDLIDLLIAGDAMLRRARQRDPGTSVWLDRLAAAVERARSRPDDLEQRHLFDQTWQVLQTCALRQPLLILLDDLQWADRGSIALLFYLGRQLRGSRILIVCAYRPEDLSPNGDGQRHPLAKVLAEFRRLFGETTIDLARSDTQAGRNFVDVLLDTEPNQLGEGFRTSLHRHTGGHPLFTVELLRAMQERGDLVKDSVGRWVEGEALDWQTMPARVEGVIAERITRLPQELHEILTIASVEGHRFTAEVLAHMLHLEERQLFRNLVGKLGGEHRLIRELEEAQVGDRYLTRFEFEHILFQKYLYNQLGRSERRLLHGQVAATLERLYPGVYDGVTLSLAHHYSEAGDGLKAVPYLQQAGDRARDRYDHEGAIGLFQRALAFLTEHDERGRAVRTVVLPGQAHHNALDLEVKGLYERALSSLSQIPSRPDMAFNLHLGLGECLVRIGASEDEVMAQFKRCLELAADEERQAEAHFHLGQTLHIFTRSDLAAAEHHYTTALNLLHRATDTERYGQILANLGYLYRYQGKYEASASTLEDALEIARRLEARPLIAETLIFLSGAYLSLDREEEAEAAALEGLAIAQSLNNLELIGRGHSFLSDVYLKQARMGAREPEAALPHLHEMVRYGREFGIKILAAFGAGGLADYAVLKGDQEVALDALAEAALTWRDADASHRAAPYEVDRGELLLGSGDQDGAEAAFAQARLDCGEDKARAEFLIGRAYANVGAEAQARLRIDHALTLISTAEAFQYWLNVIRTSPYWGAIRRIPEIMSRLEER